MSQPRKWPEPSQQEALPADVESIGESTTSDDTIDQLEALRTLNTRASRLSEPSLARKVTSIGTTGTTDPNFEVDYEGDDDQANPKNWSFRYKAMAMAFLSCSSVLYSTSYTSGIAAIASDFHTSETIVTLGLTFYLVGLAIGSMFMAPMSEIYGRKPVSVGCLFVFTVLIIPCALSKSVEELIIVRFIGAFFGSVMISSAPGMVADLVQEDKRALAMSIWSIGPVNGPGSLLPTCWMTVP